MVLCSCGILNNSPAVVSCLIFRVCCFKPWLLHMACNQIILVRFQRSAIPFGFHQMQICAISRLHAFVQQQLKTPLNYSNYCSHNSSVLQTLAGREYKTETISTLQMKHLQPFIIHILTTSCKKQGIFHKTPVLNLSRKLPSNLTEKNVMENKKWGVSAHEIYISSTRLALKVRTLSSKQTDTNASVDLW
jgi:hypothetical protein